LLTDAQKLALRDWLQANVHKAVREVWYREGIKDEDTGQPVYGECPRLDADGNPTGETYWGRTFIVRRRNTFDWQEVVRRVWRKAQKQGYDATVTQVADFLRQYKDNILGWAGVSVITAGIALPESEIDAQDPDA